MTSHTCCFFCRDANGHPVPISKRRIHWRHAGIDGEYANIEAMRYHPGKPASSPSSQVPSGCLLVMQFVLILQLPTHELLFTNHQRQGYPKTPNGSTNSESISTSRCRLLSRSCARGSGLRGLLSSMPFCICCNMRGCCFNMRGSICCNMKGSISVASARARPVRPTCGCFADVLELATVTVLSCSILSTLATLAAGPRESEFAPSLSLSQEVSATCGGGAFAAMSREDDSGMCKAWSPPSLRLLDATHCVNLPSYHENPFPRLGSGEVMNSGGIGKYPQLRACLILEEDVNTFVAKRRGHLSPC